MTITHTICTECEKEQQETSNFCPHCGAEDPWEEVPQYEFDEDDFPYVFSCTAYDSDWGMWRDFCDSYFGVRALKSSDIAGFPERFPRMKYMEVNLYYKITKTYDLKGPFLSKEEAREA